MKPAPEAKLARAPADADEDRLAATASPAQVYD
jgi:hypothetical protein